MEMVASSVTVFWYISWSVVLLYQHTDGLSCMNCRDEASPQNCRETVVCGMEEVCYTREYTDHKGRQAFHLGCEDNARCDLFKNPLFGKKREADVYPAPYVKCYNCCSADECNTGLCLQAVGSHLTTTQTPSAGCPDHFVEFKESCYLFAPGTTTWTSARDYCRDVGANMISITSKTEHDFLVRDMNNLKASFTGNFWTGGFFSHAAGEWEWVDGSPFSYAHWYEGQPPTSLNQSTNYYIVIGNPAYSSTYYPDAPMWVDNYGNQSFGVLCKRRHL